MKRTHLALFGFVVAFAAVHAIVAYWTPIQGDAWNHWIWAGRHQDEATGAWLTSFLSTHFTFDDLVGYLLARCRVAHVLLTPTVLLALVTGLFVVAMRRLPRATWHDILGLVLASALLWLAQPSAGVTLFHTENLATYGYGCAVAVWFIAPFRCNWQPPRWMWPLLAIAGYCVGTSSRAIATATLVGVILALRTRRARWMWIALGGLVAGTIAGYVEPPWLEVARVARRGFEQNLVGPGLLKFIIEEGGELVSLVAAFVLVDLVLGMLGRPRADTAVRPDAADTLRWFGAWFATAIWCLFGPRYNEATLLPASCMLVIAALPYLLWLATSPLLRYAIAAVAVGVHLIAWPLAVTAYARYGAEGDARMAAFTHAKPGTIAFIEPYSRVAADFWFLGEDLGIARQRQLVAMDAFGLRDIVFTRNFRRLDLNPGLELALEVDGASDAQLRAARVPPVWAGELAAARKQFELFTKRLRDVTHQPVSARLVVKNVRFAEANARPLLAAWSDHSGVMIPRTLRSSVDPNANITVRIYRPEAQRFNQAWLVEAGAAREIQYHGGSPYFRPLASALDVVIACNAERCLAIDAFIPRF